MSSDIKRQFFLRSNFPALRLSDDLCVTVFDASLTFPARQAKFARLIRTNIRIDKLHKVLSAGVRGAATCQGGDRKDNEEKVWEGILHLCLDVLQLDWMIPERKINL